MDGLGKNAESATKSIMGIAAGIGVFKVVSAGIDLIKNSVSGAVSRIDTLNNSSRVFQNMGYSTKDTKAAMDALTKSIQGMPTALDDGVQGVQMLASSVGDIGKSEQIFAALNDGILGFGGSTQDVSNAVRQLSQAFAGGKVDAETWNSMLDSGLGPALNAIAKQMGITAAALKSGLSDGTISVSSFQDALIDLDKNGGGGLTSLHQIAQDALGGIGTSMTNAKTAVTRGVADIISAIDQGLAANNMPTIAQGISAAGSMIENALKSISSVIPGVISKIAALTGGFGPLMPIIKTAGLAVLGFVAIVASASAIAPVITVFSSLKQSFTSISGAVGLAGGPLTAVIAIILALAAATVIAYNQSETFRNAVAQVGTALSNAFNSTAPAVISAISTAISGVKGAFDAVIGAISQVLQGFNSVGGTQAVFNAVGTVISTIAQNLAILAQWAANAVSSLAGAGSSSGTWTAIGQAIGIVAQGIEKIAPIIGAVVTGFLLFKPVAAIFSAISTAISVVGTVISFVSGLIATIGGAISSVIAFFQLFGEVGVAAFGVITAPIGLVVAAIAGIIAILVTAYAKVGWFRDMVNSIWTTIVSVVTTVWNTVLTTIVSIVTGIWTSIQPVITAIGNLWTAIQPIVTVVWTAIQTVITTVINVIMTIITTVMGVIGATWSAAWTVISTVVSTVWNIIMTVISTVINVIAGIITAVMAVINGDWSGAWQAIQGVASTIWNAIVSIVSSLINAVMTIISSILSAIASIWSSVWNGIKGVVSAVWNGIVSLVSASLSSVASIISNILSGIASFMSGVWNGIKSAASSAWNGLKSIVSNGISAAYNAVKSFGSKMVSAGKDFVEGFIKGVKGMIGKAVSAAEEMGSKAVGAVKKFLHIGSPSKVMKKMGMWTGMGFLNGVDGMIKPVTKMSERLAAAAVPDVGTVDFTPMFDTSDLSTKINKASSTMGSQLGAAVSSSMDLSNNFTVEVPVNLDGEEVARITATPMQKQLNDMQTRSNRIRGMH